jgi:hypothetical protein
MNCLWTNLRFVQGVSVFKDRRRQIKEQARARVPGSCYHGHRAGSVRGSPHGLCFPSIAEKSEAVTRGSGLTLWLNGADPVRMNGLSPGLVAGCLILWPGSALAQQADTEPESIAIVELGAAAARDLKNPGSSFGPDAAVEVTPIENWLEIEAGVSPLFARHSTEWDVDLLFKKPWTLSKKAELMVGVGPAWDHSRQNGVTTNSFAGEAVLDFMFWPSGKHRFGWYLEPGYEYSFARGHDRSIGISGGLLIAIR